MKRKNTIMSFIFFILIIFGYNLNVNAQQFWNWYDHNGKLQPKPIQDNYTKIYEDNIMEFYIQDGIDYSQDKVNNVAKEITKDINIIKSNTLIQNSGVLDRFPDVDHNGKFTLVFERLRDYRLGEFNAFNSPICVWFNQKDTAYIAYQYISTNMEMDQNFYGPKYAGSVICHELQHILNYEYKGFDEKLTEGFSTYLQYIIDNTIFDKDILYPSNYLDPTYINTKSLNDFDYGMYFLLVKYVADNYSNDVLFNIYKNRDMGINCIFNAIPGSKEDFTYNFMNSLYSMNNNKWFPDLYSSTIDYQLKQPITILKPFKPDWKFINSVGDFKLELSSDNNIRYIVKKIIYKKKGDKIPIKIENLSSTDNISLSDNTILAFTPITTQEGFSWNYNITKLNNNDIPSIPNIVDKSKILFITSPDNNEIDKSKLDKYKEFSKFINKEGDKEKFSLTIQLDNNIPKIDIGANNLFLYDNQNNTFIPIIVTTDTIDKVNKIVLYTKSNLQSGSYTLYMGDIKGQKVNYKFNIQIK